MGVSQLGYVVIDTADVDGWCRLADAVGFETTGKTAEGAAFRLDADRSWRIAVQKGEREALAVAGWEAPDADTFLTIVQRLRAAGQDAVIDHALASERGVRDIVRFNDPDGLSCELYWGARSYMRTQFRSPQHVKFVAGVQGMGHLTIATADDARAMDFYTRVLGLKLTETADVGGLAVTFLRANPRHHSLAMAQLPDRRAQVGHVMVEVAELDELGSIRDRLIDSGHGVHRDLGRHPTDGVISIYVKTPAAFELEIGWGSVQVRDADWETTRYDRSGWSWGHRNPKGDALGIDTAKGSPE